MLNQFVTPDFYPAAAELLIVAMAMVVLVADLFFGKTQRWVAAALTQLTLVGAAALLLTTIDGQTVLTFSNMFVDDMLADVLKVATCISVLMALVYSRDYLAARRLDSEGQAELERGRGVELWTQPQLAARLLDAEIGVLGSERGEPMIDPELWAELE